MSTEDRECPVCYAPDGILRLKPCKHFLCETCLAVIVNSTDLKNECTVCRREINGTAHPDGGPTTMLTLPTKLSPATFTWFMMEARRLVPVSTLEDQLRNLRRATAFVESGAAVGIHPFTPWMRALTKCSYVNPELMMACARLFFAHMDTDEDTYWVLQGCLDLFKTWTEATIDNAPMVAMYLDVMFTLTGNDTPFKRLEEYASVALCAIRHHLGNKEIALKGLVYLRAYLLACKSAADRMTVVPKVVSAVATTLQWAHADVSITRQGLAILEYLAVGHAQTVRYLLFVPAATRHNAFVALRGVTPIVAAVLSKHKDDFTISKDALAFVAAVSRQEDAAAAPLAIKVYTKLVQTMVLMMQRPFPVPAYTVHESAKMQCLQFEVLRNLAVFPRGRQVVLVAVPTMVASLVAHSADDDLLVNTARFVMSVVDAGARRGTRELLHGLVPFLRQGVASDMTVVRLFCKRALSRFRVDENLSGQKPVEVVSTHVFSAGANAGANAGAGAGVGVSTTAPRKRRRV